MLQLARPRRQPRRDRGARSSAPASTRASSRCWRSPRPTAAASAPSSPTAAVCIGPAAAAESYLDVDRLVAAARSPAATALHPGYGFVSERPELSAACAEAGIAFVGPSEEAMRRSGDKATARALGARARHRGRRGIGHRRATRGAGARGRRAHRLPDAAEGRGRRGRPRHAAGRARRGARPAPGHRPPARRSRRSATGASSSSATSAARATSRSRCSPTATAA